MTFTFVLALVAHIVQAQTNNTSSSTLMQAATNAAANVTNQSSKVRGGKYAPPPTFIAPGSATNYVAPPKSTNTFVYGEQRVWYPTNEVQAAMRDHAIARLEGREGSVWGNIGPAETTSRTSAEYAVDQRPLVTGSFPMQSDVYPVQSRTYPMPVGYYPPVYSSGYYSYPGYGYYQQRNLFGIEFDAVVSPAFSYAQGWSVRGGGRHYPTHQRNYPTHQSGGRGDHRGRGR